MAGRSDRVMRKFSVLCVCFTLFNLTLLVALCTFNICSGDEVFSLSDDRWRGAKLMMGERTWKHGGGVGRRKNRTIQKNKSEKFQLFSRVTLFLSSLYLFAPTKHKERGKMILFITRINHYLLNSVNVA